MKKLFTLLLLCVVSLASFAAVKVGDSFVASNGNTYKYRVVQINGSEYYIEVTLAKCVQTGDVAFDATVIDRENYNCKVTMLDLSIFNNPSAVTSVSIPNSIDNINRDAFKGTSITELRIPASVKELQFQPGATKLQSYIVDEGNAKYSSKDGVLFNKDQTWMIHYPADKSGNDYSVPDGVTGLLANAFQANKHLVNITLPSTVTEWDFNESNFNTLKNIYVNSGNSCFYDVDGVLCKTEGNKMICYPCGRTATEYTIPSPIQVLCTKAFNGSNYLTKLVLGETVEELEATSICNLGRLTDLTISKNVSDITSGNPIQNCKKLQNINVETGNEKYKSIDGVLFDVAGEHLITYPVSHGAEYTVPEGTLYIDEKAFNSTLIEKVTLANSVVELGTASFGGCSKLTAVITDKDNSHLTKIGERQFLGAQITSFVCPSSLREIGNSSFANIPLAEIQLNEGLETLGMGVFVGTKITSVVIPSTLKSLSSAFQDTRYLNEVIFSENSVLTFIGNAAFKNSTVASVNISNCNALTSIGLSAFQDCTNLQEITIPRSVNLINGSAFKGCTSMESVEFEEGSQLTSIYDNVFANTGLLEISLPEGLTRLDAQAFHSCDKLQTIDIPASLKSINLNTFLFCTSLTEINVAKENTVYSSSDGILLSKDKKKLIIFPAGKASGEFTLLPPSITTIGQQSFYSCENLTTVTIPKKVNKIELRAFYFCPNLKHIAFLGDPVATIGTDAFDDGTAAGYSNIKTRATLYVRAKDLAAYQAADFWKDFTNIETSFENGTEEFLPMSDTYVNMVNSNATVHSLVIPTTATNGGKTYHVGLIGDYAFEENNGGTLKEVITFENVEYIGAKAFKQAANPSIENIIFVQKDPQAQLLSTYRFELLPEDLPGGTDTQYMEIADGQHIFVRKSDCDNSKTQWPKYAGQIDYKIPDAQIGTKYGTFAREFDVDFADCADNEGDEVIAFTAALTSIVSGGGDYGEAEYHVRMESINVGQDGDGTYVPKNTGVLLKCMNANATSGAYYCIGERASNDSYSDGSGYSGSNVMEGTTVDAQPVISNGSMYVMSGGLFHKVNNGKTVNMPVHRAYLTLPEANAKVVFFMDDATLIKGVEDVNTTDDAIFNLSGMRVKTPSRGIYVKGGKKIIVK